MTIPINRLQPNNQNRRKESNHIFGSYSSSLNVKESWLKFNLRKINILLFLYFFAPLIVMELPDDCRAAETLNSCKSRLKTISLDLPLSNVSCIICCVFYDYFCLFTLSHNHPNHTEFLCSCTVSVLYRKKVICIIYLDQSN